MQVYIDRDFKCHMAEREDLRAVNSTFFDGKCDAFIEGYRFIPAGESWVRSDGTAFQGEMIAPWRDSRLLEMAQLEYEKQQLEALLEELYEQVVTA